MDELRISKSERKILFGQQIGMRDYITYALGKTHRGLVTNTSIINTTTSTITTILT